MTVDSIAALGVERMDEAAVADFLASQGVGTLALPTDGVPYVLPISFGYDGERRLYFTFVTGETSRKAELVRGDGRASFLVYAAESPFTWRSVVSDGTLAEVPRSDWAAHEAAMADNAWHPDVFERAMETEGVLVYRFDVEEWTGLRHTGLPPAFENPES